MNGRPQFDTAEIISRRSPRQDRSGRLSERQLATDFSSAARLNLIPTQDRGIATHENVRIVHTMSSSGVAARVRFRR